MKIDRVLLISLFLTGHVSVAFAGIPECNNIRIEQLDSCELQANVDCMAGCDRLGIYETSCATKLHTVCRETCSLSAEVGCTDECTVMCETQCNAGVDIRCEHNCYGECAGSCEASCEGKTNQQHCMASCEATCDGECDIQCAPLVDADCYTHCRECCTGSCDAQVNMDCQTSCQDVEFEECEREFQADCSASCSADGALFCNGQYILSGSELPACVEALIARGANLEAEGSCSFGTGGSECSGSAGACSVDKSSPVGGFALAAVVVAGCAFGRRRRTSV